MVTALIERVFSWFGWKPALVAPPTGVRINIPRSVLHALYRATTPRKGRHEPLALLRVRYASEDVRDVLVAVGVIPFADEAYVEGDEGANFDTRWVVAVANREVLANAGLVLAHLHGGRRPNFSSADRETNYTVIAPLSIGVPVAPYGAMVLGDAEATAVVAKGGRLVAARVIVVPDLLGGIDLSA
jgi:hypothetical protein